MFLLGPEVLVSELVIKWSLNIPRNMLSGGLLIAILASRSLQKRTENVLTRG